MTELMAIAVPILLLAIVVLLLYRRKGKVVPWASSGAHGNGQRDYFIGLNFLLNDEPDEAVDLFIAALELNATTLETHLALCTLLRRRGKVDQAIEHGLRLLGSAAYGGKQCWEIRLNLLRSYIAAGLLDRAEQMLGELRQAPDSFRAEALESAITVYQMERDWEQALAAAEQLMQLCAPSRQAELRMRCSHFRCELAETALALDNLQQASVELQKARTASRDNVRCHFLVARLETMRGEHRKAAQTLASVVSHHERFAAEAAPLLCQALARAGMQAELRDYLEDLESRPGASAAEVLALLPRLREQFGDARTMRLLSGHLLAQQDSELLAETLALAAGQGGGNERILEQAAAILRSNQRERVRYRCENCGFGLRKLHWSCPACGQWDSVRPLIDTSAGKEEILHA